MIQDEKTDDLQSTRLNNSYYYSLLFIHIIALNKISVRRMCIYREEEQNISKIKLLFSLNFLKNQVLS